MANAFARETRISPSYAGVTGGFTLELEVAYTGSDVQDGFIMLPVQAEIPPDATTTVVQNTISQAVIDGGANRGITVLPRDAVIPVWAKG